MAEIIIIDNDLDVLETTGALLENAGFEIHSSDSVEGGLEIIDRPLDFTRDDVRADEFITKPVRIERLAELMRHYIS